MTGLVARRARNASLLLGLSVAFLVWHARQLEPMAAPQRFTGWTLLGLVAFLAIYNARKKVAVVPLGSSAAWLQWHIYAGLFAVLVFFLHTGLQLPTGIFETVLSALFLLVAISGIGGLYVSRRTPARLARRGEEVIYERIPRLIHGLGEQAKALALESVATTRSRAIADFYATRLSAWFCGPQDAWQHIVGRDDAARRRAHAMDEFRTCLGADERPIFDELAALVARKGDLDFHRANQGLLKYWFFVHVPVTHALLLFVVVHVVLIYAFGGAR
jgi:hypothetical protein